MTYVASRSRLGQAELGTRSAGCEASEGFARKQRLHVVVAMPHILCCESPAQQASRLSKHALLCVDHPQQIPAMSETAVAIAHSSCWQPHGPTVWSHDREDQRWHTIHNDYSSYTVLAGEYRTARHSQPGMFVRVICMKPMRAEVSCATAIYSVTYQNGAVRRWAAPKMRVANAKPSLQAASALRRSALQYPIHAFASSTNT